MLKTSTECEIEEEKEKLLRSRYAQRIRTTERAKKKRIEERKTYQTRIFLDTIKNEGNFCVKY